MGTTRAPAPAVRLEPGDLLDLPDGTYRYGRGHLRVRVLRVRDDLTSCYEGRFLWIEGIAEDVLDDRAPSEWRQVLVPTADLSEHIAHRVDAAAGSGR